MRLLIIGLFLTSNSFAQGKSVSFITDVHKYFSRNIEYSNETMDSNYTGLVLCKFTVDKNGRVRNAANLFSESKSLGVIVLKSIAASDGKWTFPISPADSITIILPVYFMISTPEKVINPSAKEQVDYDHLPFEPVSQEIMLPNSIFMKPVICFGTKIICYNSFD